MDMTRGEIQDLLAKFSTEDAAYRQALIANPRDVIEKQFQISVPANVHIVLPHAVAAGDELSDADLEAVAGGGTKVKEAKCEDGVLNTVISMEASLL